MRYTSDPPVTEHGAVDQASARWLRMLAASASVRERVR